MIRPTMHFRFRGNNIQVVKSQPDRSTGKAKSVPLGSINRATLAISDKLRANCSRAELSQIEDWVRRYQTIHALKRRHAAMTLPEQIAAAAEWFSDASPDEARRAAEEVADAIMALRRVFNRRELV